MELLTNVVTILVIGFVVLVTAYTVIAKIAEEQRKNSDYAIAQLCKIFEKMPKLVLGTFDELKKREEEDAEKKAEKYRAQLEKL